MHFEKIKLQQDAVTDMNGKHSILQWKLQCFWENVSWKANNCAKC